MEKAAELGTLSFSDAAASPSFSKLVCVSGNGLLLAAIDPTALSAIAMDCSSLFANDPIATIAYEKTTGGGSGFFVKPKVDYFYFLTESGKLYSVTLTSNFLLGLRLSDPVFIADTGFQQTDVSLQAGQYGSMLYNAEHNCLLVASYLDGESAHLYQIDLNNYVITDLGSFGDGVYPVVALYQHSRNNAMRVELDSDYQSIFVGETATFTAVVRPLSSNSSVTWSSSDPTVASVDSNGVVTGIADGEAVITATTVDVDDNGNHATASATVNVKGTFSIEGTVNAMINTDEGAKWVDIDLSNLQTNTLAESDVFLTGGGRYGDMLYGSDCTGYTAGDTGYYYSVDPANGYALHKGVEFDAASFAVLDLTAWPAATIEYNGSSDTINGTPIYLSSSASLVGILDMDTGKVWSTGALYFFNTTFGAMTYKEAFYNDEGYPVYLYYGLTCQGDLYLIRLTYSTDYSGNLLVGTRAELIGNIGIRFGDSNGDNPYFDKTQMSMTLVGENLVISNESNGCVTLYYVDVNNMKAGAECFGVLEGVTGLSCLNSEADAITEVTAVNTTSDETELPMTGMLPIEAFANDTTLAAILDNEVTVQSEQTADASAVNTPVGSTNAVSAAAEVRNISGTEQPSTESQIISICLTESVDVTNGLISISYDPSQLEFLGESSEIANTACRNDAENGIIIFDYASAQSITAGDTITNLTFYCKSSSVNTDISIKTVERNRDAKVDEAETVIQILHSWIVDPDPPEPKPAFVDVFANDYFYEAVQWAAEQGIALGTSETTFSPNDACTRAQAVTFLWRAAGSPAPKDTANPFKDVASGEYYYDAVLWAAEQGIALGTSETTFSPNDACTRAHAVTFLWRAAGSPAPKGTANPFKDVASGEYYYDAVLWAAEQGIALGTGVTTFSPDDACTRAQAVTFLWRAAASPAPKDIANPIKNVASGEYYYDAVL